MLTEILANVVTTALFKQATPAAPAANDEEDQEQVAICDPSVQHRVSLTQILKQLLNALSDEEDQYLRKIAQTLNPANTKLTQLLEDLERDRPEVYARYQEIEADLVNQACGAAQNRERVPLTQVLKQLLNALSDEEDQYLRKIAQTLNPANEKLTKLIAELERDHPEVYARLQEIETDLVFTEQCGCEMVYIPSISSITPNEVTLQSVPEAGTTQPAAGQKQAVAAQGQEVQITLNGANFPADAQIEFLLGDAVDSNITLKDAVQVSPDGTAITLTIVVAAGAAYDDPATPEIENQRTVRVVSAEHPQLIATLPDALTIKKQVIVADNQCEDGVDNDGDTLVDFPNDPQCVAPNDNLEADDTCDDDRDNDNDGLMDENDPDCATGGPEDTKQRQGMSALERYIYDNLLNVEMRMGGSTYPSVSGEIPANLRPAAEAVPNLQVHLSAGDVNDLITILGKDKESGLWQSPAEFFELLGRAIFDYQYFIHGNTDYTHRVQTGAELAFRFHAPHVFFDVYGGADYRYSSQESATLRVFYNGHNLLGTAGLAVGSDFGTDWVTARLFGEYQSERFDYTEFYFYGDRYDYPFAGNSHAGALGVNLVFDLDALKGTEGEYSWYPTLEADMAFIIAPNGTVHVPGFIVDEYGLTSAEAFGFEGEIAARFRQAVVPLYVAVGGSFMRIDTSEAGEFYLAAGVSHDSVGSFDLRAGNHWGYNENFMIYLGGNHLYTTLTYRCAPWKKWTDIFSLTLRVDNVDGHGIFGGTVNFDFAAIGD